MACTILKEWAYATCYEVAYLSAQGHDMMWKAGTVEMALRILREDAISGKILLGYPVVRKSLDEATLSLLEEIAN